MLFIGFALLCGAEIGPKFLESAGKDINSVLYVRSLKKAVLTKKNLPEEKDCQKLVKDIDVKER